MAARCAVTWLWMSASRRYRVKSPFSGLAALVLQPGFMGACSTLPVAAAGALLVAAAPARPVEDGLVGGAARPEQAPEQPAHPRHGQWPQLRRQVEPRRGPRPPPPRSPRGRGGA